MAVLAVVLGLMQVALLGAAWWDLRRRLAGRWVSVTATAVRDTTRDEAPGVVRQDDWSLYLRRRQQGLED